MADDPIQCPYCASDSTVVIEADLKEKTAIVFCTSCEDYFEEEDYEGESD